MAACMPALADNTTQSVSQVTSAVTLDKDVDYHVTSATPFTTTGSINLTNTDHAVIILDALKPSLALNQLAFITINGEQAVNGKNCQVKIYNRGAIIMPYGADFKPLTVYTSPTSKVRAATISTPETRADSCRRSARTNSTTASRASD